MIIVAAMTLLSATSAQAADTPGTGSTGSAADAIGATSDRLAVTVTRLDPVIPAPGDTLVIGGTLTNTGLEAVRTVSVRLRFATSTVRDRGEISSIVNGDVVPDSKILWSTQTTVASTLGGGQSAPYKIEIPMKDLGLSSRTASVQIVTVEALGDTVAGDGIGAVPLGARRRSCRGSPTRQRSSPPRSSGSGRSRRSQRSTPPASSRTRHWPPRSHPAAASTTSSASPPKTPPHRRTSWIRPSSRPSIR